jgi:hypothetical protein
MATIVLDHTYHAELNNPDLTEPDPLGKFAVANYTNGPPPPRCL